ncbi:MAG: adenosylhomocysteinase [Bacteroidales bacterium]|nr:adenosylhomocysteinase [Bacteroidales bacterium]SKC34800.1 adenosylhomocysteinase [Bacteroidales bacterium WCE2008]MBQ1857168.1 adenosylhomocysteinase [Bacteroidales bacterium]MBQ2069114.1 adenosylhomocysteinase [Bacteroidales bacterium]MBQ2525384.1 adenosylhomocysteinase [Bacteroidales bacterium]
MASEIRNTALWESGELKIEWVRRHMPLLDGLQKEFTLNKPFKGLKIALSVHLEAKTAHLCEVLASGGAEMYITGSNPLSTQDDIAAALVHEGLNVFAVHGATPEEYESGIRRVIEIGPDIIIDDGGDLVNMIHSEFPQLIPNVIGGCEETTTGILRLQNLNREKALKFPMMLVNDAACKHFFDNRYGTGQSVWDGINRTTNLIVAGKTVVVAGYGWCGKGVAMRAKGLGAKVIITEVDPIKAMEAVMDGFNVMTMKQAAAEGDIFVTVTGCDDVITTEHFPLMKDGAILCNAGHFDCEVAVAKLREYAVSEAPARNNIMGYKLPDGRTVYVIAEGRLVNLAAGDGHPAEIMDMSFAIQALSAKYLADHRDTICREPGKMLNNVPAEIDREVADRKLKDWGIEIDVLTPEQHKYLYGE